MAEPQIQIVASNAPQTARKMRKPRHSFQVRQRPWIIQPIMIAPVLPGETLKNLQLQSRAVTMPIKNGKIGWWAEYYFFYVKHRDLAERQAMMDLVMENTPLTALNVAAKVATYHVGSAPDFTQLSLNRIVETYFRNEDELGAPAFTLMDGMPLASITSESWLDSVKPASTNPVADDELPGTQDDPNIVPGFTTHHAQWEFMRQEKLTDLTYDDFLKSYGVRGTKVEVIEKHEPELIRFIKDWTYPSNTVDPATGAAAAACSWATAERADKDRFFSEPGFLVGLSVFRPKVYLSKQKGAAISMLTDAFSWLPAVLSEDPYTSLRQFGNTVGPLAGNVTDAAGYWVDVRDLFVYGDQFVNFALTETNGNLVALPTAGLEKRFIGTADANALFVDPLKNYVEQDGIVQLQILGRLTDQT
jgi:hypothetical protein